MKHKQSNFAAVFSFIDVHTQFFFPLAYCSMWKLDPTEQNTLPALSHL